MVAPATKGGASFPSPARAAPWFYYKRRPFIILRTPIKASVPAASAATTLGPCVSTGPYSPLPRSSRPLREYRLAHQLTSPLYHTGLRRLCWRKGYLQPCRPAPSSRRSLRYALSFPPLIPPAYRKKTPRLNRQGVFLTE